MSLFPAKPSGSKFFGSGSSDSEPEPKEEVPSTGKKKKFPQILNSSDDEDKVRRPIKNQKEKKFIRNQDLSNFCRKIRNFLKINDFNQVSTEFDALMKYLAKPRGATESDYVPNFVIKMFAELEDRSNAVWDDKESKTKLSKLNLKALSSFRQKIKKNNKSYESQISRFRQFPTEFEETEVASTHESSSSEVEEGPQSEMFLKKPQTNAVDRFGEGSDDDNELYSGKQHGKNGADKNKQASWIYFLKLEKEKKVGQQKRDRKEKDRRVKKDQDNYPNSESSAGPSTLSNKQTHKSILGDFLINKSEITIEKIIAKMREIIQLRGRRMPDRAIISSLYELKKVAEEANFGPAIVVKILYLTIPQQLEYSTSDYHMKSDVWKSVISNFHTFLSILVKNSDIRMSENITDENESFVKPYAIMGNPLYILVRIHDELVKIMQNTDCYSMEYLTRMKDVLFYGELVAMLQSYVEKNGTTSEICEVYLLRIEQIYYMLDKNWLISLRSQLALSCNDTEENTQKPKSDNEPSDAVLLKNLCLYVFRHGNERSRARATLCQVYHHAIHDRWNEAKQLFLMSRIQETIQHSDTVTHILYNRVIVQLGLCAFRRGNIQEAYDSLRDLQMSGRAKELLAQGLIMKNVERTAKQEIQERRQLLPFHMHINLELVECVYLASVLLLEGAYSVAPVQEARNKYCSKGLIFLARNSEKLAILGPPETTKEYIYAAFKALKTGDWQSCYKCMSSIKCWRLFVHAEKVLKMLETKIKKECLVSYMFANCHVYTKIPLDFLMEEFKLCASDIRSTVNRIVIEDSFPARWNGDSTVLVIFREQIPFPMHFLSQTLLDKLESLVDQQEKIVELRGIVGFSRDKIGKLRAK